MFSVDFIAKYFFSKYSFILPSQLKIRTHLKIVISAPLAPKIWGEPYLSPSELGDLGG
jgi:hypothetical protein